MKPSKREQLRAQPPPACYIAGQLLQYFTWNIDQNGQFRQESHTIPASTMEDSLKREELAGTGNFTARTRVLFVPRRELPQSYRNMRFALGTSEEILRLLISQWQLHPYTIESILYAPGLYVQHTSGTKRYLIVKAATSCSVGYDFVSVVHDCAIRSTNVLYHGVSYDSDLISSLQNSPQHWSSPFWFVALLYRSHQLEFERHRNLVSEEMFQMEASSGFGLPGRVSQEDVFRSDDLEKDVDYSVLMQRLTYCGTDIALLAQVGRVGANIGAWLEETIRENLNSFNSIQMRDEHDNPASCRCAPKSSLLELLQEVRYSYNRAINATFQVEVMSKRVESQTTVITSLIAQKQADYTSAIAMDSKRDSTSMKTVAIMTVVFLPTTSVATFFSMNMINWSPPGDEKPKVSRHIWVFAAVAIPLTVIVVSLWIFCSRRELVKARQRLQFGLSHSRSCKNAD